MPTMLNLPCWVLLHALRYALGRNTFTAHETAELIKEQWPNLARKDKILIVRELRDFITPRMDERVFLAIWVELYNHVTGLENADSPFVWIQEAQ